MKKRLCCFCSNELHEETEEELQAMKKESKLYWGTDNLDTLKDNEFFSVCCDDCWQEQQKNIQEFSLHYNK